MAAAIATTWGIGKEQDLPWKIPVDSEYLEQITSKAYYNDTAATKTISNDRPWHNAVIMGRLSWESIPMKNGPMPNRFNIVISRNPSYKMAPYPHTSLATSVHEALEQANTLMKETQGRVFVLGGGQIYEQAMDLCTHVLLTRIHDPKEKVVCDSFMPPVNISLFAQASHQELEAFVQQPVPKGKQICDELEYEFLLYVRRSSSSDDVVIVDQDKKENL
ncbi:dihydrofolate reductase-like domain-containing protein [Phascolomyces articulosus]|uniref:Dihydrofolate reductase n=1 Tax=Phascolomyces articulosus TaxID=60185 RepID=A0AAD5PA58_9FUNG|nr:dihydrofolate reductase-like domain-containing protein [Phascolomyces articulosus]